MKTKVDDRFSNFTIHKTLAQRSAPDRLPDTMFLEYDTAYFFTIKKNIPELLINPTAPANTRIPQILQFALAKKDGNLYIWGDQNNNGTFADDPQIVRSGFFLDTAYRWLGQFDKKIDYSFTIPHITTPKKDIRLHLELDIYKLLNPDQKSYSLDILYNTRNSYQITSFRSGWKRFVAVAENSTVAKFWGMSDEGIYFFPKRNLKRTNKIDYTLAALAGDTVRLGKKDWRVDFSSFSGDTLQLTQTLYRQKIISRHEGGTISSFNGADIFTDALITSSVLSQKKKTLLLFWAFWCGPCRQKIPEYNTLLAASDTQSTNILGVIIDENKYKDSIKKDISNYKVQWKNIFVELQSGELTGVAKTLRVETIPTYAIFDNLGKILYRGGDFEDAKRILLK